MKAFDTWLIWRWFTPRWWRYTLDGCKGWENWWCRVRNHPAGVKWFAYGEATEPDMRCRNCGEDLG